MNKKEKESESRFLGLIEEIEKAISKCGKKDKHLTYGEIINALDCVKEGMEEECEE